MQKKKKVWRSPCILHPVPLMVTSCITILQYWNWHRYNPQNLFESHHFTCTNFFGMCILLCNFITCVDSHDYHQSQDTDRLIIKLSLRLLKAIMSSLDISQSTVLRCIRVTGPIPGPSQGPILYMHLWEWSSESCAFNRGPWTGEPGGPWGRKESDTMEAT